MKIAIRAVVVAFALAVMAGCAGHQPRLCDPNAPYPGEGRPDNWGKC